LVVITRDKFVKQVEHASALSVWYAAFPFDWRLPQEQAASGMSSALDGPAAHHKV